MIVTQEKITVTKEMMDKAGMTRGAQYGVPDGNGGLRWKVLWDMGDADFDAIEEYFINKKPE